MLILFVIYSCRKGNELNTAESKATAVSDARNWYEKTFPLKKSSGRYSTLDLGNAGPATQGDFSQLIKPDWNRAALYERLGKEVVELPLDSSAVRLGFPWQQPTTANDFDASRDYSKSSVLILGSTNGYKAYIMTIIADPGWLGGNRTKLSQLSYRNKGAGFSGRVLYFTPTGKLVSGHSYSGGKITGNISALAVLTTQKQMQGINIAAPVKARLADCTISTQQVFTYSSCVTIGPYRTCTDHYDIYITINCPSRMSDQPTGEDDGGYTPPGDDGTTTTTVEPDSVVTVEPLIITNNVKDSCLKKMVNAAIARNIQYNLTQSMNSIFGRNANFNLNFVDTILHNSNGTVNTTTDGETQKTYTDGTPIFMPDGINIQRWTNIKGMDVRIALNIPALRNASEEYITATILHEVLHAYFRAENISLGDHDIMVDDYIPWYKNALHAIYPTMGEGDLTGLAYGGLMTSGAFNNSPEHSMLSLYQIVNDSFKSSRSGTPCH